MQGDLFQIPVNSSVNNFSHPRSESFLEAYRITLRLDQLVMMMILVLVIFAVVFSMGVEKGKRSVPAYSSFRAHKAASAPVPQAAPAPAPVSAAPAAAEAPILPATIAVTAPITGEKADLVVTEIKETMASVEPKARPDGKFTIQLVTYKSDEQAQKQIEKLVSKGYEGFIIPSGSYYQVCVNAFDTRQTAQGLLKTLQAEKLAPSDAYVRAMPR